MWRKWRSLGRADRRLLWQAMVLLPPVMLALRLVGFCRTSAVLGRLARLTRARRFSADAVWLRFYRSTYIMRVAAANSPIHAQCVPQALVFWFLLRCRGIESELRVGVRRRQERLEAHAWVEYLGVVLLDDSDGRGHFAPFTRRLTPPGE